MCFTFQVVSYLLVQNKNNMSALLSLAAAANVQARSIDWLEVMLQTTLSAGIIRASAGVAVAKAHLQVFEEYMSIQIARKILKYVQHTTNQSISKQQELDTVLGDAGITIPCVFFLVASSNIDNGGFLSCGEQAKFKIPPQYGVIPSKNNIDCPALRKAALVSLTPDGTKHQKIKEIGSRVHGMTLNAKLMLAANYKSIHLPELKRTSGYVLVGDFQPVFQHKTPRLKLPSSQESFFSVSGALQCMDITQDTNFQTLFFNIHGISIQDAIKMTAKYNRPCHPTAWLVEKLDANRTLRVNGIRHAAQQFRNYYSMDHELPIAHDSEAELQEITEPPAKRQCLDIGKTVMDVSEHRPRH